MSKAPTYKCLYLYITHACTSGCSFCYRKGLYKRNKLDSLGPVYMTPEMALKILEWVFKNLEIEDRFNICFWGGEPTMNMPVIEAVLEEYPQFIYRTNTHGGMMDQKMYEFFSSKKNFGITWSLGNAYEKYGGIREKINAQPWTARLLKENQSLHNANLMVTKYDSFFEDFVFLQEHLSKNILIDIATKFEHKEEDLEKFAEQYIRLIEFYKDDPFVFGAINPANRSNAYLKEFGPQAQIEDFRFCRSGLERLFVDTAGQFWQCDNMYVCQHNCLGSIEKGIDFSKLDFMRIVDENREEYLGAYCRTCELYKQCSRNKCLGLNLEWMGNMFEPEPSFCKMCKVLFKVTQKYIEIEKLRKGELCQA